MKHAWRFSDRKNLLPILFWSLSAVIVVKHLAVKLYDPDLWWHLASGRWMWTNGVLLRADVFTHTLAGAPWINFEWLSQLILYGLFDRFGLSGIFVGKIVLSLTALGLLIYSLRHSGARGLWLALLGWAGFLMLQPRLYERVELATLIFLPTLALLLLRGVAASARRRRVLLGALFILMAAWVNLHGGFIYGLALTGALGAGAFWAGQDKSGRVFYVQAFLTSLLGICLNPYGPGIFKVIVEHLSLMTKDVAIIQEWARPTLKTLPLFWAMLVAGVTACLVILKRGDRRGFFWIPAFLLFGFWGTAAYRSAPLMTLPVLHLLAVALKGADTSRVVKGATGVGVLLIVALHAPVLARPWPETPASWRQFPLRAAVFVERENIKGTLYNNFGHGGYLAWAFDGRMKTFMDGRYLFVPYITEEEALSKNIGAPENERAWQERWARFGVNLAIVQPTDVAVREGDTVVSLLDRMFPRSAWALIFWDDSAFVFAQREKRFEPLIHRFEYRQLSPYNLSSTFDRIRNDPQALGEARAELARHRQDVEFSFFRQTLERTLTGWSKRAFDRKTP